MATEDQENTEERGSGDSETPKTPAGLQSQVCTHFLFPALKKLAFMVSGILIRVPVATFSKASLWDLNQSQVWSVRSTLFCSRP